MKIYIASSWKNQPYSEQKGIQWYHGLKTTMVKTITMLQKNSHLKNGC